MEALLLNVLFGFLHAWPDTTVRGRAETTLVTMSNITMCVCQALCTSHLNNNFPFWINRVSCNDRLDGKMYAGLYITNSNLHWLSFGTSIECRRPSSGNDLDPSHGLVFNVHCRLGISSSLHSNIRLGFFFISHFARLPNEVKFNQNYFLLKWASLISLSGGNGACRTCSIKRC